MLKLIYRNIFEKDLKRIKKRGKNIDKLKAIVQYLLEEKSLLQKHHDHMLQGNFKDHRECHIEPDWLLIYKKTEDSIILERTGSHSDLFK
jgi:mRNA interferase YafQ